MRTLPLACGKRRLAEQRPTQMVGRDRVVPRVRGPGLPPGAPTLRLLQPAWDLILRVGLPYVTNVLKMAPCETTMGWN